MNRNKIFSYDDGVIRWRDREAHEFKSIRNFNMWRTRFLGRVAGCVHAPSSGRERYIRVRYNGRMYANHRVIWEMHNGKIPDGMEIDHIDGNGLNNRIENLRCVPHAINCKNLPKRIDNTSGLVGVTWGEKEQRWIATIGGKRLGAFKELAEAKMARDIAEVGYGYHQNHGR